MLADPPYLSEYHRNSYRVCEKVDFNYDSDSDESALRRYAIIYFMIISWKARRIFIGYVQFQF